MFARLLLGFAVALAGSLVAVWLHVPLPWMLGALVATACTKISGLKSDCHPWFRNVGQWAIGLALGLYFTPEVFGHIVGSWLAIVLGAVFAVIVGLMGTWMLKRLGGVDIGTAFFSSTIGGASEMANLADRYGGRVDWVASAHSLRILLVVAIVPMGFRLFGSAGADITAQAVREIDFSALPLLLGLTGASALLALRTGMPNAWVLGPMVVTILLTVMDIHLSALPQPVINLGQLFIGWNLGNRFKPGFFRSAPRFMAVVALYTLIAIALGLGLSWVLAQGSDLPVPTIILGTAPGGIAEMCITAKVMQLGVPVVTAFQVSRLVLVLVISAPLYRWMLKRYPAFRE